MRPKGDCKNKMIIHKIIFHRPEALQTPSFRLLKEQSEERPLYKIHGNCTNLHCETKSYRLLLQQKSIPT